jgi:uncharacterized coiled-coil DUF342 family protein
VVKELEEAREALVVKLEEVEYKRSGEEAKVASLTAELAEVTTRLSAELAEVTALLSTSQDKYNELEEKRQELLQRFHEFRKKNAELVAMLQVN